MNQALHKRTVADIPIFEFSEVTSTHDIAREWADGARSDLDISLPSADSRKLLGVISADYQSEGRGRRERVWASTPGSSMLCTFILTCRKDSPMVDVSHLMVVVANLLSTSDCEVNIKWPNDLVVENRTGKKIGGCLTEIHGDYLFVGIGVNLDPGSYGSTLKDLAISLSEIGNKTISTDLVNSIVEQYSKNVGRNISNEEIWDEYKKLCSTIGSGVRVEHISGNFEGIAKDVNLDGSLVLEKPDGEPISVFEGDVIHLRK